MSAKRARFCVIEKILLTWLVRSDGRMKCESSIVALIIFVVKEDAFRDGGCGAFLECRFSATFEFSAVAEVAAFDKNRRTVGIHQNGISSQTCAAIAGLAILRKLRLDELR